MASISAIVITRNEQANIEACLRSLDWTDEIVVVDSGSSDKTVTLAKRITPKVFLRKWDGFGAAKSFAVSKAKGEWILWVDADERVPELLKEEILKTVSSPSTHAAFSFPRKSNFLGRWILHSGWYPGRVVRLFKKGAGEFTGHKVHERLIVQGSIGELKSDILHYTDPNLFHYFEKFNRYTSLGAEELVREGTAFSLWQVLVKPWWTFLRMYFIRLGFLDGFQGFVLAVVSSAYVFIKYTKLWELDARKTP